VARPAARRLLAEARNSALIVCLPQRAGAVMFRRIGTDTYTRLEDDEVRLAIVLAMGNVPLVRAHRITPVISLAGGEHIGTHRLAITAHGDGIPDDPLTPALPDIRVIRAVKLQQTALVR